MGVVYQSPSGSNNQYNQRNQDNRQDTQMSTAGFISVSIIVNIIGYFIIPQFLAIGTGMTITILVALDVVLIVGRASEWSFFVSLLSGSLVGGIVYFTVTFSGAVYYAAFPTNQTVPTLSSQSPIHQQLNEVRQLSRQDLKTIESLKNHVTVHPYVLGNRLFFYVDNTITTLQIEIPQKLYTSFLERLKMNLGSDIKIDHSKRLSDRTKAIQDFVNSQNIATKGTSVLIADGSMQNLNYQEIFKDEIVFRSSSLDRKLITNNLSALAQSIPISPQNTYIANGIPSNTEES